MTFVLMCLLLFQTNDLSIAVGAFVLIVTVLPGVLLIVLARVLRRRRARRLGWELARERFR